MIAQTAFWFSIGLLAYTYAGYPAIVWAWSALAPRPVRRDARLRSVTVVMVAQDEAAGIAPKIANLRALDYPEDLVEIVVASDGSRDETAQRARRAGASVVESPVRRGKPAALSDAVRVARGEILVFCDVRQHVDPGALRAIVAPFADPEVGVVSGALAIVRTREAVGRGLGLYRRYETFVRECESRIDSTTGATGAFYAVRASLFEPIPPDMLADDMWLPCRALRRGWRVVVAPGARAVDRAPPGAGDELGRKARTLAGCFQIFARERWLLDPRANRVWLQTVSHKGLRLVGPAALVAALVASASLAASPTYRAILVAQIALYAAAAAGALARRFGRAGPLAIPYTFCLLQAAVVIGAIRFALRRQPVTWKAGPARRLAGRRRRIQPNQRGRAT